MLASDTCQEVSGPAVVWGPNFQTSMTKGENSLFCLFIRVIRPWTLRWDKMPFLFINKKCTILPELFSTLWSFFLFLHINVMNLWNNNLMLLCRLSLCFLSTTISSKCNNSRLYRHLNHSNYNYRKFVHKASLICGWCFTVSNPTLEARTLRKKSVFFNILII